MTEPAELTRRVRVACSAGMHARPCHAVVSLALAYECELRIRHGELEVNGKSILELMTLNAGPDAELDLRARGDDADVLLERLGELFESGFGERS